MQAPQSWNDRSLLQDEPFRSHFMALSLASTRRNEAEKHNIMLAKAVKDAPGGLEAAQAWFELAFIATDSQDPKPKSKLADSDIRAFVQFYWHLRSDEANALLYLEAERKKRGYGYCPYNTKPKLITDITSIPSKPKCGRAKANKRSLPHAPSLLNAKPENISTIHPHSNLFNKITQKSHVVCSERSSKCEPAEELQAPVKMEEGYDSTSPNILDDTHPCEGVSLPQYESTELMLSSGRKRKRVGSQQKLSEKTSSLSEAVDSKESHLPKKNHHRRGKKTHAPVTKASPEPPHGFPTATHTSVQLHMKTSVDNTFFTSRRKVKHFRSAIPYAVANSSIDASRPVSIVNNDVQPVTASAAIISIDKERDLHISQPVETDCENLSNGQNDPLVKTEVLFLEPLLDLKHNCLSFACIAHSQTRQRTEDTGPLFVNGNCALASPVRAVFEETAMDTEDDMTTGGVLLEDDEDDEEGQEEEETDQYVNGDWVSKAAVRGSAQKDYTELKEEEMPLTLIDKSDDTGAVPELAFPLDRDQLRKLPPIWAKSRQEVCETFDWFRSYQGGVYFSHDVVKGYLLSAFASRRDRFEHNGRLIISHGFGIRSSPNSPKPDFNTLFRGGKAESSHKAKGHASAQQADDQLAQDKSVRALLRNYRERRPVVLLIDDKYILFPYDLAGQGVTYAVLGYYMIIHAWAEYHPANNERGRVVRYKFAFQWCEGQGAPWWIQTANNQMQEESHNTLLCFVSPPIQNNLIPAQKGMPPVKIDEFSLSELRHSPSDRKCQPCSDCGTKSPKVYQVGWSCLNPICNRFWMTVDGQMLPEDLEYELEFLKISTPHSLPPGYGSLLPPPPMPENSDGITTDYAFTRGWHCTRCGRLSCRYKWQYWECMNCEAVYAVSGRIRIPKEFWFQTVPVTFHDHFIVPSSKIEQLPIVAYSFGNGRRGQAQTFVLPRNRGFIHHIQAGTPAGKIEADNIFQEYQEQAASGSLIFRRWPLRAHKCRGTLLSNYFSQNSGEPYQYVGGTANTVPFDKAPGAVVKARNLIEDRISAALGKVAEFNEVLSAAYMERQKMAFHSDDEIGLGPLVAGLSLGSPALMHFRLNPKHDPHQRHKGVAITFVLRHGDILVMDGAGVQEFYEHTVIPTNFRIAATARFISANRI
ncbi:hypothetical protein BDQ12DRAFT_730402 [Crucibulum laeve]|uniref:Alpha-ketoglutarate-dependent dioxygenase AlkB-like domain-containing protein n=1 Tax=Crucibulum laeve TaxID=68775 RepID=A0A5C3MG49_9AGAR|nr:hypothetical protein BDQ12DRAFT_730402 [Crucibulum laeve]